jgi:PAS domain S-box-containing protein
MSKIAKNGIIEVESICKAVFENSMDAILITVPDGQVLAANPAACEMFGMTEAEITSSGRKGLVDPTDENLPGLLAERESKGNVFGEVRQIKKDGSVFPTEFTSRIFKSPDGNIFTISIIRDITKKKQTINELEQARDYAEDLIKTANVIFVQLDYTGTIIKVNKTLEELSGYKEEELLGKDWFDILVPKNRFPEVWEEFTNITRDQKIARTYTNPILTKNGEERQILWSNSTLLDDKKEIGSISYGIDITDINRKKEELQRIEYLLRTILYSVPITIFATDKEGFFTLSDGKELKNFGLKPGEIVGVSAYDIYGLLHFIDFSGNTLTGKEVLSRALNGDIVTAVSRLKDVYFENHIGPVIDSKGEITGVVGVAIDITERKQIEDTLRLNQENLDLALKSVEMGVWHYDISRNKRIFDENTCRLLDIEPTTFKGTPNEFYEVVHPKDRAKLRKELKISISTNVPYSVDYRVMRKDGTVRYISARGKRISWPDGKAKEMLGILWDSTDGKLIEEKLKKSEAGLKHYSEELRALYKHLDTVIEKERNQIARDLHDDLGQKLAALNLNISWIRSRMGVQSRRVNDKLAEMEGLLSEAVESINKTSYRLRPAILDKMGIKAALEWQLSDISKSTGISYNISFVPEEISIDRDMSLTIFRIVQEGLTNVVRHSKATHVSVSFSLDWNTLRLSVRDNGIGIAQDKVTDSKSFGLIGMRERVSYYGGVLEIIGRPGKGTIIRIKLPLS